MLDDSELAFENTSVIFGINFQKNLEGRVESDLELSYDKGTIKQGRVKYKYGSHNQKYGSHNWSTVTDAEHEQVGTDL